MKKLIAVLLFAAMLVSMMVGLTGCTGVDNTKL